MYNNFTAFDINRDTGDPHAHRWRCYLPTRTRQETKKVSGPILWEPAQRISTESVYLETPFIGYLVARPSRDVVVAGHQQTTQEWWANRRSEFPCSVSQVVIDEASSGDPTEAEKRLMIIGDLRLLEVTQTVEALTRAIMAAGILPPHAVTPNFE